MIDYETLKSDLRTYYDQDALRRAGEDKAAWKIAERAHFLESLRAAGHSRLLEVGAGTGDDSLFFQSQGLSVTATDLSPVMVATCRDKGVDAREMDFLSLDFDDGTFDAIYALNCLLHVPTEHFADVLANLRRLLIPEGLFYLGMYGGIDETRMRPGPFGERYFVSWSETSLVRALEGHFNVDYYRRVALDSDRLAFHSLILRRL